MERWKLLFQAVLGTVVLLVNFNISKYQLGSGSKGNTGKLTILRTSFSGDYEYL